MAFFLSAFLGAATRRVSRASSVADHPRGRTVALAVLTCVPLLTGCTTGKPQSAGRSGPDVTQTGSIPDGLPPAIVAAAQEEVGRTMRLGLANYRLNVGDNLEISFLIDSSVVQPTYRLNPSDEFDVDFRTHPEYNRTVLVRPDGRISLPGKNGIKVAGLSPEAAAALIKTTYDDVLIDPVVTIMLRKFRTVTDDFRELTQRADMGRVKVLAIEPDGKINLPMVPPVQAAGRTVTELAGNLTAAYHRQLSTVSTSVRLASLVPANTMVFGEVRAPGPVTLQGARTLAQVLGSAGGILPTAAGEAVRIIRFDAEAAGSVRIVDIGEPGLADSIIVPPNATVYVPPSLLAKTARAVDLVVRQILLFNGTGFGVNYITGPSASTSTSATVRSGT
ncbi:MULTISPECIES: polysaccharide biosynthesis/export family protein [unclassified Methylobacterium]|uniref:polysaccharide biosynthesis/export family protein n=1 Tax=unclassified Methylobacterium TaxID=2615210 RepID=UPI001FBA5B9E|nr:MULTISPECIES: polysaccharide biosynthesis/export family protein [unclassified Methylobacterium]MCJ2097071.1 polysaccharide biosynthesis/export family protein [Methylobacterium sp. J-072]MCJ2140659.1 polysaccharide biosynthesis/export family protein [Methylobacterium sp. E-066]